MMKPLLSLLGVAAALTAPAQVLTSSRIIRAVGQATVSTNPDRLRVTVGVVTQATTAEEASSKNSEVTAAVTRQLQQALGSSVAIKTVSYSLTPVYNYPQGGGTPTLTGYTATNNLQVTSGDLSIAGKVIDNAIQAGANNIGGLQFDLKNDEPVRAQALTQAGQVARNHATAIAAGLNVQLGAVVTAEESATVRPVPVTVNTTAAGGTPTPIVSGPVEVSATVTVDFQIAQ